MPAVATAVPAGTVITNTAGADYTITGTPQSAVSNSVSLTTVVLGTPSTLELYRYAPSAPALFLTVGITPYFDGASFVPAPAPSDPATGTSIDLSVPVPLEPAANFSQGDPVFVLLTDPDGNINPAVADTIRVEIEDPGSTLVETVLLTETGVDTGAFTGYILSGAPSETANDGQLFGYPGAQFTSRYTDTAVPVDVSTALFLFDASGVLWVTAVPGKGTVSAGDYLTYTITVQNSSGTTVPSTVLTTDLPVGFRYEAGSARTAAVPSPDPLTAPDGRSLAFSVGDIPPGGTIEIVFVARVGAAARTGRAVSPNTASSGVLVSNTALAVVRVKEDLFKSRNTIMGRIVAGACGDTDGSGVGGVTVFLEDGTFVVSDEKGRFHFEGVRSGTHVLQLDLETVSEMYDVVACDDDTRQAGRPWSRFVDLAGGSLWRVDFYLVPKAPTAGKAVLVLKTVSQVDRVTFSASMRGEHVPLGNVRFRVTLPEGVEFEPGTVMLEGEPVGDPVADGRILTWNIGDVPGVWEKGITFETKILENWDWAKENILEPLGEDGTFEPVKNIQGRMTEVVSSASVTFDTPLRADMSTPEVQNVLLKASEREETRTRKFVFRPHFATFESRLTAEDKEALDIIASQFDPGEIGRVQVTGHTDNVPISRRGRQIYYDNHDLSSSRAKSVARYLRSVWDLPSGIFITDGKGPDEPVASNDTARGRTLNRRVEVNVITTTVETRTELEPIDDQNITEIVIEGLRPGQRRAASGLAPELDVLEPGADAAGSAEVDLLADKGWLEDTDGSLEWVYPPAGYAFRVPGIRVAVKHDPGSEVKLTVNGNEAHRLNFMGTEYNAGRTAALSVWKGIELKTGDNVLKVEEINSLGLVFRTVEREVHLSGSPVSVQFLPEQSVLVADGRTVPVVAVRLTDEDGYPARIKSMGQYFVDTPHQPFRSGGGRGDAFFGVEENGIARLMLKPTVRTGDAAVRVRLQDGEEEIRVWLNAQREEWILVGLAEGTVGYNTGSGNMQSLEDSGGEEDLYYDGRVALFAKGQVKGEYLLTMSYDSNGPHGAAGEGLHGTIDPDSYYTLYGDGTEQDYEAPTSKKLYLKIEKGQFYALFGDTSSGLTVTELSRYDRRITGLRSELRGEKYSYNLFASETEQGYIRDEIPGDGTSGIYRLSVPDVVINSDFIRIEVRDRFQSHVVLATETLTRHVDYSIDYSDGTLFFKKPVPVRDEFFNPVIIVAEFETSDPDAAGLTYGVRGEVALEGAGTTVGLSRIHEDRGQDEGDITGIDITARLSEGVHLRAEAAASSNVVSGNADDASAFIVELAGQTEKSKGTVYLRETESGFGLGHQNSSEVGTRKRGLQVEHAISETVGVTAELFDQENLETGADRQVQELGAVKTAGNTVLNASVRQARDTDSDGTEESSRQLTAGARWHSGDQRLELRANREQSLGDNANTDYPTRTLLGTDYQLTDRVSLYAEQEYTDGDDTSVTSSRLGMRAKPWEGAEAVSTVDRKHDENGERVYATTGLDQTWRINPRWRLSAGLESARVIRESTSEPLNPDAPPVSSEEDYTAISLGTGYTLELWDFDLRYESRSAESSDKRGIVYGMFGEPADGVGISLDLKQFRTESDPNVRQTETDLRIGIVYRPWDRRWTFLNRLDYFSDEETGGGLDMESWKVVDNLNANFRPADDLQVSFKYGIKQVKDTVDGQLYSGTTQLLGVDSRYDLTRQWDIGAWTSVLAALDAGSTDYGLGASVGYGFIENLWLSFGYNLHGYEDSDFSQGDFTAQGPFIKFRLKFDQESLRGILGKGRSHEPGAGSR
ncbi:MAG: OmpA family protein [bacterium]|nr:OmpA family protein [bacterium]